MAIRTSGWILGVAAVLGTGAVPATPPARAAEEALWTRVGLSELGAALAAAQASGKRLLVGLGGSPG